MKEEEDRRSIWRELLGESKEETSRMSGARRNARIEVYEIRGSSRQQDGERRKMDRGEYERRKRRAMEEEDRRLQELLPQCYQEDSEDDKGREDTDEDIEETKKFLSLMRELSGESKEDNSRREWLGARRNARIDRGQSRRTWKKKRNG